MKKISSYEKKQEYARSIKLPEIETIENKYSDKRYIVECIFPEFTTICPKTHLPDFGTIKILYEPDKKIIELKSLKLYFVAFRNIGFFHENFTNRIMEDIIKVVKPRWIYVEAKLNNRGGIYTTVARFWSREEKDNIEKTIRLFEGGKRASPIPSEFPPPQR